MSDPPGNDGAEQPETTHDGAAASQRTDRAVVEDQTSLGELALLFFRLGATAFGGPAAHIAMIEDEVVRRRQWLTPERFLDLLGAANLIPGPTSTEMAIHIGWERRRWAGLLVAGVSFIVPAMLITGACGWAYVHYGTLPQATMLLYGVKPVILAVVLQALWGLAPRAAPTWPLRLMGVAALAAAFWGVHEIALLLGSGVLVAAVRGAARRGAGGGAHLLLLQLAPPAAGAAVSAAAVTLPGLFWLFFRTGSVLFGSGYVLLAFLRADLVERLRWMTEAQLLDAIVVGQVTPGPVFTTATFVGYVLAGPWGALVATAGIFLPAFVCVALSAPLLPRLRASAVAGSFLDGVNVASMALMTSVTLQLGRAAIIDVPTVLLLLASAFALIRFKVNSTWLIAGGCVAGWLLHLAGLAR